MGPPRIGWAIIRAEIIKKTKTTSKSLVLIFFNPPAIKISNGKKLRKGKRRNLINSLY
jgi:hypothetical protein